jgi:hypothetical protein
VEGEKNWLFNEVIRIRPKQKSRILKSVFNEVVCLLHCRTSWTEFFNCAVHFVNMGVFYSLILFTAWKGEGKKE